MNDLAHTCMPPPFPAAILSLLRRRFALRVMFSTSRGPSRAAVSMAAPRQRAPQSRSACLAIGMGEAKSRAARGRFKVRKSEMRRQESSPESVGSMTRLHRDESLVTHTVLSTPPFYHHRVLAGLALALACHRPPRPLDVVSERGIIPTLRPALLCAFPRSGWLSMTGERVPVA